MKQKQDNHVRKNINGCGEGKRTTTLQERQVIALEMIANFCSKIHMTPKGRIGVTSMPKPTGYEKHLLERAVTALEQSATVRLQETEVLTE
jgi:hypothetical protein